MKKSVVTLFVTLLAASAFASDTFMIDKAHSEANFRIRHMMSKVSGKFDDFAGKVTVDRKKPSASSVEFTIKASSIDTGNANRDEDLRSANFFEVEKHPEITFKSEKVVATKKKNVYDVTGNLTMHGVTKRVTLPVEFLGFMKDPWGNERGGFSVSTTLNRKDFGINWNKALDNGGVLLGDDVEVSINLETVKSKADAKETVAGEKKSE